MLLHKSVANDTRVRREARALAGAGHEVTIVHLPPTDAGAGAGAAAGDLPATLIPATLGRSRKRLPHPVRLGVEAVRLARRAGATGPDVVHAHDAAMLLPGMLAANKARAKLVYDSHELATGVPYRRGVWPAVVSRVERLGAPRADAVITVSDGIAARLSERYPLRQPPTVVRNLPDLPPPGAAPAPDLRRGLAIGEAPLILHQGAVAGGRGCETLLGTLAFLPEAHLVFLGAEGAYANTLRLAAHARHVASRTHMLPPTRPEALLSHTAQADVGVSLLEDSCENHRLALPNKLFEYLAAGLPVVVSNLPEAGRLVRERGIGWCADPSNPEAVAAALRTALAQRGDEELKARIDRAAAELSWEREKLRLLALYEDLASATSGASR